MVRNERRTDVSLLDKMNELWHSSCTSTDEDIECLEMFGLGVNITYFDVCPPLHDDLRDSSTQHITAWTTRMMES